MATGDLPSECTADRPLHGEAESASIRRVCVSKPMYAPTIGSSEAEAARV
jgi:hypothetical protein